MRVVAGKYRSRVLKGPGRMKMRPTSDRLRETLFNILGAQAEGCFFVDAFAGTGAIGIEALSRGARRVVFIENHGAAAKLIRENLRLLGAEGEVEILEMDAERGIREIAKQGEKVGLIFLDPPYGEEEAYERALGAIEESGLLGENSLVIAEHEKKRHMPEQIGRLKKLRTVKQGDGAVSFYRLSKE